MSHSSAVPQHPLVIVGAGPIGLAAAAARSVARSAVPRPRSRPAVGSPCSSGATSGSSRRGENSPTPLPRRCSSPRVATSRPRQLPHRPGMGGGVPGAARLGVGDHRSRRHPSRSPRRRRRQAGPRPVRGLRPGRGRLHGAGRGRPRPVRARGELVIDASGTWTDRTRWVPTACPRSGSAAADRITYGIPDFADPAVRVATPASVSPSRARAPRRRTRWSGWHRSPRRRRAPGRLAAPSVWHR